MLRTSHLTPLIRSTARSITASARMSSSGPSSVPYTVPLPGGIPSTHTHHTESTTTILVPKANTAFLNPVQQYNRDLSIAVIRAWNEMRKEEAEEKWKKRIEAKPEAVARKKEKARKRKEAKAAKGGEGSGAAAGTGEVERSREWR